MSLHNHLPPNSKRDNVLTNNNNKNHDFVFNDACVAMTTEEITYLREQRGQCPTCRDPPVRLYDLQRVKYNPFWTPKMLPRTEEGLVYEGICLLCCPERDPRRRRRKKKKHLKPDAESYKNAHSEEVMKTSEVSLSDLTPFRTPCTTDGFQQGGKHSKSWSGSHGIDDRFASMQGRSQPLFRQHATRQMWADWSAENDAENHYCENVDDHFDEESKREIEEIGHSSPRQHQFNTSLVDAIEPANKLVTIENFNMSSSQHGQTNTYNDGRDDHTPDICSTSNSTTDYSQTKVLSRNRSEIVQNLDSFIPAMIDNDDDDDDDFVITTLAHQMQLCPHDVLLQEYGVTKLWSLALKSLQNKYLIMYSEAGALTAILMGMNEAITNSVVQECGVGILWSLAAQVSYCPGIGEAGGIDQIRDAMRQHADVERIIDMSMVTLNWLSLDVSCRRRMDTKKTRNAVVKGMRDYLSVASIQENGCLTLSNMSVDIAKGLVSVVTEDEVNVVANAMETHPNVAEVQRSGCFALKNFSLVDKNVQIIQFANYSIPYLLEMAASRFPEQCQNDVAIVLEKFRILNLRDSEY